MSSLLAITRWKAMREAFGFLASKWRLVVQFMTLQGITAAGNLLYGLLCVRLLPTGDYAMFVVLFGVQNTLLVLMDSNFSNSLIPLVGEQVHDHKLIADYVASLRRLAWQMYALIGVGLVFLFPQLVRNRHWGWPLVAGMVVTLLVSTWFTRLGAQYGAVLILLRERTLWYRAQMISSLGTLALLGVFYPLGWLTGPTAILINVAGLIFVGVFYTVYAKRKLGVTGAASKPKTKAIVRLAMPNVPHTIFYALQGQISLFLITFFGHTSGVASVGALGRLNQIYVVFMQILPLVVEPYFAKLPKSRLRASYAVTIGLTMVLCTTVTLLAYLFPGVFLWVLGPKYAELRVEVVIAVLTSSVAFLSGTLWCIHTARRFVYYWSSVLSISLTMLVQVLFITHADLSTVRSALLLNLATVSVALLVNVVSGVAGFTVGPRTVEPNVMPVPEFGLEPMDPLEVEVREMELKTEAGAES